MAGKGFYSFTLPMVMPDTKYLCRKGYIDEGQFEPNTMLPKIEAGVSFLEKGNGRKVIITSIDKALEGYLEKTGTIIE